MVYSKELPRGDRHRTDAEYSVIFQRLEEKLPESLAGHDQNKKKNNAGRKQVQKDEMFIGLRWSIMYVLIITVTNGF